MLLNHYRPLRGDGSPVLFTVVFAHLLPKAGLVGLRMMKVAELGEGHCLLSNLIFISSFIFQESLYQDLVKTGSSMNKKHIVTEET